MYSQCGPIIKIWHIGICNSRCYAIFSFGSCFYLRLSIHDIFNIFEGYSAALFKAIETILLCHQNSSVSAFNIFYCNFSNTYRSCCYDLSVSLSIVILHLILLLAIYLGCILLLQQITKFNCRIYCRWNDHPMFPQLLMMRWLKMKLGILEWFVYICFSQSDLTWPNRTRMTWKWSLNKVSLFLSWFLRFVFRNMLVSLLFIH